MAYSMATERNSFNKKRSLCAVNPCKFFSFINVFMVSVSRATLRSV